MLPDRVSQTWPTWNSSMPPRRPASSRLREGKSFGTPSSGLCQNNVHGRSLHNSRQKQNVEVIVLDVKECAR